MYLSRQLYEEALHVQFYLTLLDTYLPDPAARAKAFDAIENIPSIRAKAEFCFKWIDSLQGLQRIETREQRRQFLLNLICFAGCIEGLFFFAAFAYVYYLRSRGLLNGLASGTNWVFRDESGHMAFAFEVIRTAREEEPDLFDDDLKAQVVQMFEEAVDCETLFAAGRAVAAAWSGCRSRTCASTWSTAPTSAWRSSACPSISARATRSRFMDLQDVQEVTNFFERRVSAYQVGVQGEVAFDAAF